MSWCVQCGRQYEQRTAAVVDQKCDECLRSPVVVVGGQFPVALDPFHDYRSLQCDERGMVKAKLCDEDMAQIKAWIFEAAGKGA